MTQVQSPTFFFQVLLSLPGLCLVIHYISVTKITSIARILKFKKTLGRIDNLKNMERVFSVMFLMTIFFPPLGHRMVINKLT